MFLSRLWFCALFVCLSFALFAGSRHHKYLHRLRVCVHSVLESNRRVIRYWLLTFDGNAVRWKTFYVNLFRGFAYRFEFDVWAHAVLPIKTIFHILLHGNWHALTSSMHFDKLVFCRCSRVQHWMAFFVPTRRCSDRNFVYASGPPTLLIPLAFSHGRNQL